MTHPGGRPAKYGPKTARKDLRLTEHCVKILDRQAKRAQLSVSDLIETWARQHEGRKKR